MPSKKSSLKGWFICIIGAIFYWYEYLLRVEPGVMVNEVMQQLSVTASGFGMITALYYYAYTPMQLLGGMLLDRFGTKKIIGLGIITCVLGNFLFTLADSVYMAGSARFLMGFGSSFAFVGVLKLGAEWLPKQYFAFLVGLATSLGMIAGMVGTIILSTLISLIGWHGVLNLGTLVGLILIPVIFIFIKDTPHSSDPNLNLEISLRQTFEGLKKIVKSPQMWVCGIIANVLYLSLSAFAELWGVKFLEKVYALNIEKASIACSMIFFGWLVGGPFSGWFSDYIQSRKKILLYGGIISALSIGLIVLNPFTLSYPMLCGLLFVFGFSSSAEVLCFAISKESNSHSLAATSVAFTNFIVMIGGVVFQPLLGLLLDWNWSGEMENNLRVYSKANYQLSFMVLPICVILGTLLLSRLKETLKPEKIN